jgi:hypothetical protein
MIERFKAILLREFHGFDPGVVIDVMAGGEDFNGRWIVLAPVELAGQWAEPLSDTCPDADVDAAITAIEAAHVLSLRRGRSVPTGSVTRYVQNGILKNAGRPIHDRTRGIPIFLSRREVWEMVFPIRRTGRQIQQEEPDEQV